jgi:hypothetical protein
VTGTRDLDCEPSIAESVTSSVRRLDGDSCDWNPGSRLLELDSYDWNQGCRLWCEHC